MSTEILGVRLDNVTMDEAVDFALRRMAEARGGYVCTPNPEILWLCRKDAALREAINRAALVLPDGVGDLLGARIMGRPLKERVPGVDFAAALLGRMQGSVFLLGGKPGVAERAAGNVANRWPNVQIAGWSDGYFDDEAAVLETIQEARPDFLMVCLGAGKQEKFMARHCGDKSIGLMAGLGGTVDVLAGDIKRAPDFFIRHRMEWLYRLVRQPKRMGRAWRLPLYLAAVLGQRIEQWEKEN